MFLVQVSVNLDPGLHIRHAWNAIAVETTERNWYTTNPVESLGWTEQGAKMSCCTGELPPARPAWGRGPGPATPH